MNICVVIPVYKEVLSDTETLALKQCIKVLGSYDVIFCEPNNIETSVIRKHNPLIKVKKFENSFFKDILGYNKLMLSTVFYNRFQEYDYMLLYQLDAYAFKNDLKEWCEKGYDYIGSPWLASKPNLFKKIKNCFKPKQKKRAEIFFKVGNGGFSLRKISSFIKIINNNPQAIQKQLDIPKEDYRLMEDVFWSIEAPKLNLSYKVPNYKEAIFFSIDRRPKIGFKLTTNQLPFGCHGFNKKNVIQFWETKIPELKQD